MANSGLLSFLLSFMLSHAISLNIASPQTPS